MKNNDKLLNIIIHDISSNLLYNLNLKRKVTVIVGDSGETKSYLVSVLNHEFNDGFSVKCSRHVRAPRSIDTLNSFEELYNHKVVILDEQTQFGDENKLLFKQPKILSKILKMDIYFIFITRELANCQTLLYSPKEVYEFEKYENEITLKQYFDFSKIHQKDFPEAVCEDVGDGLEFWNKFILTETVNGNGNFHKNLYKNKNKLHFIDLANYVFFNDLYPAALHKKISIADIESFEWVVLQGSMFDKDRAKIENMERANSSEFLTLEKFYKGILDEISVFANGCKYDTTSKGKLNCALDNCSGCFLKDNCLIYYDKDDKCENMIRNAGLDYLLQDNKPNNMFLKVQTSQEESTNSPDTYFGKSNSIELDNLEF